MHIILEYTQVRQYIRREGLLKNNSGNFIENKLC